MPKLSTNALEHLKWFRYIRYQLHYGIKWLSEHISSRNYQILVSVLIGIVAGLSAVVMKFLVFVLRDWMYGNDPTTGRIGFVFFPAIGIMLTAVYIRYILRRDLDMGFPGLIQAISRKKVKLPPYETYAHILSSSLTVGLGGSVGLEAPIVRTGAAIGSNMAGLLRVGRSKQTLFLACGASAGMAAIFNSPVAAVIFAFEVLITDLALPSFIPLLMAAASGAVVARFFYYEQLFYLPTTNWEVQDIPFYLLLGVLCGLISVYFIRSVVQAQEYFQKRQRQREKILLGGLFLGLLIFLAPPLFGEGYETVNQLLKGDYREITDHSLFYGFSDEVWFLIGFAALIIFTKAFATAITLAAGGNGGVFAPSMFSGAVLGFIFAATINQTGLIQLNEADFIAVAMAGILSGVIKSPLTGIFLIAEITSGYALFVPLMIVSAASYFVAYYFEPQSILTRELFLKGLWVPTHERDLNLLKTMNLSELIEANFSVVHPEMNLGEFVEVIAKSNRNVFPVTDEQGRFLGIILLDEVREIIFKPEKYADTFVKNLMHQAPAVLRHDEPLETVMDQFEKYQAWNLPVTHNGIYLGFVSKSSILGRYRELLQEASGE